MICRFLAIVVFLGFNIAIGAPRDLNQIVHSGVLNVCYVPWFGGKVSISGEGPDYELAIKFAKYLKLKVKLVPVAWNDLFSNSQNKIIMEKSYTPSLLDRGICDVYASNIGRYPWRLSKLNIIPLMSTRMLVVTRKDKHSLFRTQDDLKGKMSVAIRDTNYHAWIESSNDNVFKKNPIKLKIFESGDTVQQIIERKADFALYDIPLALYLVKKHPADLTIAFPVGRVELSGWAISKKQPLLCKKIESFFEDIKSKESSVLSTIYMSYFGVTWKEYENLIYSVLANK